MSDIAPLLEIAGYGALLVVPPALLGRLAGMGDGMTLAELFAIPVDPPWPRGIQEEEPVRWRVERLTVRRRVVCRSDEAGCRARLRGTATEPA